MFALLTVTIFLAVAAFAVRERSWANRQRYAVLPLLLVAMLGLGLFVQRLDAEARVPGAPILLAVAADVSLSMGTMPDPGQHSGIGTRLERVQGVLLPLLANLAAAGRPAMIGVTAFTAKSETILAWDDDLSLAQEIVEFVLSTGLLTEAGSDLGEALAGSQALFENLPEDYRGEEYSKYLLIASDGEQTANGELGEASLAKLRELGVRVIALHVGSDDPPEGLPVFGEDDEFMGFEEIGGQIFSTPDPGIMRLLTGGDDSDGMFASADDDDAAATITDFVGLQSGGSATDALRGASVLLLWAALMFVLLRRL